MGEGYPAKNKHPRRGAEVRRMSQTVRSLLKQLAASINPPPQGLAGVLLLPDWVAR